MNVRVICPEGHSVVVTAGKLGGTAICPHCFTSFVVKFTIDPSSHARNDEGRSRRSRDDDDDEDEEDDRPRKKKRKEEEEGIEPDDKPRRPKKSTPRDEEEDEDDRPRRRKGRNEDDDDDDDDEESTPRPPVEEEEPIKWTPRKRQLAVVSNALVLYQVNFWLMFVIFALDGLNILGLLIGIFVPALALITFILTSFIILPAVAGSFVVQLIAWIMMFWAPAKSGARGSAITAMGFFFAPVLLFGIHLTLSFASFFRNDIVEGRFLFLMVALACLSGLISFFFSLQVLGNIASFLGLHQLAKEPITLGWFIIGGTLLRLIVVALIMFMVFAMGFVIIGLPGLALYSPLLLAEGMYWFVLRSILDLVGVATKLRAFIAHYIKEG